MVLLKCRKKLEICYVFLLSKLLYVQYIEIIYLVWFNRNNAEATAMLNEIILSRIMTSIANQNINPNFASAIHPEMLLLTACLEMEDSCWEQRLRAGMFIL